MRELQLREFCNEDIPLFKKWLFLPHVAMWYHDPLDWLDEVENRDGEFSFIHHFVVETERKPIGFCQFYEYCHSGEEWHGETEIAGTYSIDYLIGDTDCLGKGFGKAIVGALIEKVKGQPGAERIIVQPESENKASCNTLISSGFSFDSAKGIYIIKL